MEIANKSKLSKERLLFKRIIARGERDNRSKENALTTRSASSSRVRKKIFYCCCLVFYREEIMLGGKNRCEEVGGKKRWQD